MCGSSLTKSRLRLAALVLALASALTLAPAGLRAAEPAAPTGEPIRLAALFNQTGAFASIDGPGLAGARLKVKLLNQAGGVLGRPLTLLAPDTKSDPREAARVAEEVVKEGITAGVGYGDSDYAIAVGPAFQDAGIPFVSSGATLPSLPSRIGDYMFLAAFGDNDQAWAMAGYLYERLGVRRVAVWTDQAADYTRMLAHYFRQAFRQRGGEVVYEDAYAHGEKDFTPLIQRLTTRARTAQALFTASLPEEAGFIVREVREAGWELPLASGDGFDTPLLVQEAGPRLAHGVYFSTHAFRSETEPRVLAFRQDYAQAFGQPPDSAFAALGFDTVGLVADAIGRAGSSDPARVRRALAATRSYQGVTGLISYNRPGRVPLKPVAIVEVEHGQLHETGLWGPGL
ncbi:MAG: ABC transporter substrate-binding protein [Deltaproteobacteria bacterium]|nr:ABC transporter substrate-binding protein [Deltaproteobacteria bacterium]MCB2186296.1 ABC transporter substrate-binding protein [Deltaproteobacteria bacterium]